MSELSGNTGTAVGRRATTTASGVLRPEQFARYASLTRWPCAPGLETFVENYWGVTWALPPGLRYLSSTLPHPAGHLTVEWGEVDRRGAPRHAGEPASVWVTGVATDRFDVALAGTGGVLGVKFRPGGLTAMLGIDAAKVRDQTVAADRVRAGLTATVSDLAVTLEQDSAAELDRRLTSMAPDPSPHYLQLLEVVEHALADRELTKVEHLADAVGTTPRSLQRLFARFLGVGPKWVLGRYRMHDAVTAIDNGYDGSLTDLAMRLGWFDLAHFIADFSLLVGKTPDSYRRERVAAGLRQG